MTLKRISATGYELVQQDRFEPAAAEFHLALMRNPGLVRICYRPAVCLFAPGRREESEAQFELVERETGGDPKVLYYVGRLRSLVLHNDAAILILRGIVDAPPLPNNVFIWAGLI
jgi:hypothetical protein